MKNNQKSFIIPLLMVVIVIALGGYYFYSKSNNTKPSDIGVATNKNNQLNLNDGFSDIKPMYGARDYNDYIKNRTADRKSIDDNFISQSLKIGGVKDIIDLGSIYMQKGDYDTSMKRFNEAWLIDQNNFSVFWGFGVLTAIKADSDKSDLKKYLSEYEVSSGYFDTALSYVNSAKNLQSNDVIRLSHDAANSFSGLSIAYSLNGNNPDLKKRYAQKAIDLYESSLKDTNLNSYPKDLVMDDIANLGMIYGSQERFSDVDSLLSKYLPLYPELNQNQKIQFMIQAQKKLKLGTY